MIKGGGAGYTYRRALGMDDGFKILYFQQYNSEYFIELRINFF